MLSLHIDPHVPFLHDYRQIGNDSYLIVIDEPGPLTAAIHGAWSNRLLFLRESLEAGLRDGKEAK
jgi:hypothetical protein